MTDFPYFNSKELSSGKKYNLIDPAERLQYFHDKSGKKIEELKLYLDNNSFIGYLLAKKQAGKGVYSKMVEEILGPERFAHISVGDLVREAHKQVETEEGLAQLKKEVIKDYRGFISLEEAIVALKNRTQDKVSIPTEFLLALLKRKMRTVGRKALLIDGLPRTADQISYSLFFRDLINFRDDPDFFVFIEVPREVIEVRMKGRVVCPICQTSRNIYINPTTFVKYDKEIQEYYFLCNNKNCEGYGKERYVVKEGDAAGIKSIEKRMEQDQELINLAMQLQGIPKVLIRSSYPLKTAENYLEDYEIQPIYSYEGGKGEDGAGGNVDGAIGSSDAACAGDEVKLSQKPWVFKDDNGEDCCTMYAAVYALNLINQIYDVVVGGNGDGGVA